MDHALRYQEGLTAHKAPDASLAPGHYNARALLERSGQISGVQEAAFASAIARAGRLFVSAEDAEAKRKKDEAFFAYLRLKYAQLHEAVTMQIYKVEAKILDTIDQLEKAEAHFEKTGQGKALNHARKVRKELEHTLDTDIADSWDAVNRAPKTSEKALRTTGKILETINDKVSAVRDNIGSFIQSNFARRAGFAATATAAPATDPYDISNSTDIDWLPTPPSNDEKVYPHAPEVT